MSRQRFPDQVGLWLCDPLPDEVARSLQRLATAEDVVRLAVLPDVHLATESCVGVALATRDLLYPHAVGGDIGCGMAAVAFHAEAAAIDRPDVAARVLAGLYRRIPSQRQPREQIEPLPDDLRDMPLSDPALDRCKHRDGVVQLGTLGRGNHFVELQRDASDRLWLMVHSGSRGLGQRISDHHLSRADRTAALPSLRASEPAGADYLHDVDWAVRYARANRLRMLAAVGETLAELGIACDWSTLIHGDHNHVRRETHDGRELLVHRKGALPAFDGEPGVIPGSMGTRSFHVRGRGAEASLCTSSHGAGRALTRSEARRQITPGQFEASLEAVWFDHRRSAAFVEEAPAAYRDIGRVLRAQRDLTAIVRELRPLLAYKGT